MSIDFRTIAPQKYIKYDWTTTGHATLPCKVLYSFLKMLGQLGMFS